MRPGGRSALLLHGLTGTPSEMRVLRRQFAQRGWRVEVPLLPGHGAGHRELLATTWRDWLAGARRALEELTAESDVTVVGGLSMGALLAVLLAAEEPRVDAIALLSPTLRYDGSHIPRTRVFLPLAHVLPFLGKFFYWTERPPYGLRDERLQRLIRRAVEAAERGQSTEFGLFRTYVASLRQLNLMVSEVRRRAGQVTAPALILHSREDTVTSGRNAVEIHARLGSSDKAIRWLTGCDHVITLDLKKDEVAREVCDFAERAAQPTEKTAYRCAAS